MKKINRALTQMVLKDPFFGQLALRLKIVQDDDKVDTMGTDGIHLWYNKKFVDEISPKVMEGSLAHEVLHTALLHPLRIGDRDHAKFSVAADYEVNGLLLLDYSSYELPKGALIDKKYSEMTAEEIYNLLPEKQPNGKRGELFSPEDDTGEELTAQQQEELKKDMQIAIKSAVKAAQDAGKLSNDAAKRFLELSEPTVPWEKLLSTFMKGTIKADFSWYPPNQQYLYQGVHLPTMDSPCLGDVAIIVDTSGSVDYGQLSRFMSEVSGILEEGAPNKVTVLYVDTDVRKVDEYTKYDLPIRPEPKGGGGTAFYRAFEYLKKMPTQDCILIFTDGYLDIPENPGMPVIWVINNNQITPSYGDIVRIK